MNKKEIAKSYYDKNYNCVATILLTYKDELNLSESQIIKLTKTLGGGLSHSGGNCGALIALSIIYSSMFGSDDKEANYLEFNKITKIFNDSLGGLTCPEIKPDGHHVCINIILQTIDILENIINKKRLSK